MLPNFPTKLERNDDSASKVNVIPMFLDMQYFYTGIAFILKLTSDSSLVNMQLIVVFLQCLRSSKNCLFPFPSQGHKKEKLSVQ